MPVEPGTPVTINVLVESEVQTCVPLSAIFYSEGKTCLYQVLERDALWGVENYVQAVEVEVGDADAVNAAVSAPFIDASASNIRYACHPSRALVDGEAVRVER